MHRWNRRAYGHAHCVDTLAITMVELPYEYKKSQECPVEFLSTACWKVRSRTVQYATNDYARPAGQSRRIKPDDQIGAGQAQVKNAAGVVAFANPGISCKRIADPSRNCAVSGSTQSGSQNNVSRCATGKLRRLLKERARVDLPLPALPKITIRCTSDFQSQKRTAILPIPAVLW